MSINVYVRNQDGRPLMPCLPKPLRAGKAKVVDRCPFTIQLLWQCEEHLQEITVGIDKGSSATGICCVGNGTALLAAELHHRRDVKAKWMPVEIIARVVARGNGIAPNAFSIEHLASAVGVSRLP